MHAPSSGTCQQRLSCGPQRRARLVRTRSSWMFESSPSFMCTDWTTQISAAEREGKWYMGSLASWQTPSSMLHLTWCIKLNTPAETSQEDCVWVGVGVSCEVKWGWCFMFHNPAHGWVLDSLPDLWKTMILRWTPESRLFSSSFS